MSAANAQESTPDLATAVRDRVAQFARQLRLVSDADTMVPGLEWTVAELAQHVASMPTFWQAQHEAGDHFELPADFAAFSNEHRAKVAETAPAALADLIEHEFSDFIDLLSASGPRWLYGVETTPAHQFGMALNELIIHGRDLAAVSGAEPPEYRRFEGLAAAEGVLMTAPSVVDRQRAAAQPDGTYHVKFRGGKSYTWTKQGDALTIAEGKPAKADAHLATDPAMFLLSSLGRVSQLRAGLSGKMFSYGRKPWRFLGLGKITIDGI